MTKAALISALEAMSGFERETGPSHAAQKSAGDFVATKKPG
jgi:hypothetical protein